MNLSQEGLDPRREKFDAFMKGKIPYIQRPDKTLAGYLVRRELDEFPEIDQEYMKGLPKNCVEVEGLKIDNVHKRGSTDPQGIPVKGITIDELEGQGEVIKLTPKAYSEYYFSPNPDELFVALSNNG